MTCVCGHDEDHHYTDSGQCMVCDCEQFREPVEYTPGFYDE